MKLRTLLLMPLVGICLVGATQESEVMRTRLAIVERERLWQCHPGYSRLAQLDAEFNGLRTQREELLAQARFHCDLLARQAEAQRLWEAQQLDMRQQLEAVSQDFRERTEREMSGIHSRFEGRVAEIARESRLPSREMAAMAMTRYRLEKQKELEQRRQQQEQRLALEVAHQDDLAAAAVQEEKVNLQLVLQLREDEAARGRLSQLEEELANQREARHQASRHEMEVWFEERRVELERDLAAYQARLTGELQPRSGQLEALRVEEQRELQRVQKLRQAEMVEVVHSLEGTARRQFQQRLAQLKGNQAGGELLPQRFLAPDQVARLHRLPALIEAARLRRQAEVARLAQGITLVVGEQARARGIQAVLTDVRCHEGLQDLTDVCLAGVSQLP